MGENNDKKRNSLTKIRTNGTVQPWSFPHGRHTLLPSQEEPRPSADRSETARHGHHVAHYRPSTDTGASLTATNNIYIIRKDT